LSEAKSGYLVMPVQLMNSTLIPLCTHLGERLGVPIGDAFLPAAGRRSSGKRAKFLAYLACWDDSAPYVARGLLQILQPKDSQFLDADGRKLFTDRLLKGKSDPGRGVNLAHDRKHVIERSRPEAAISPILVESRPAFVGSWSESRVRSRYHCPDPANYL